jgi:hypothetical protein
VSGVEALAAVQPKQRGALASLEQFEVDPCNVDFGCWHRRLPFDRSGLSVVCQFPIAAIGYDEIELIVGRKVWREGNWLPLLQRHSR